MTKFKLIVLSLVGFSALSAQPRFDFVVRNDFFAGFGGEVLGLPEVKIVALQGEKLEDKFSS